MEDSTKFKKFNALATSSKIAICGLPLRVDSYKFCSDCYGYKTDYGVWPTSKDRDYAALTRVVEALFPYCDKVTVDGNIVYFSPKKSIPKELEPSIFFF